MIDRAAFLAWQEGWLAPQAARASQHRGRRIAEPEDPLRTAFQRDRDRIIHTTTFRRLQHKTQVFSAVEGDYFRTRLTHTLEVSQMARSESQALRLTVDLPAICMLFNPSIINFKTSRSRSVRSSPGAGGRLDSSTNA